MRQYLFAIPLLLSAAPALAQQPPQREPIRIPPELTDPRMAERLSAMSQALTRAMLDLPVGELEAIAEGREPTAADRTRRVRDVGRRSDPNFDRNIERQVAESGPRIRAAMRALSEALPAMTRALTEAADTLERAAANMPRPDYPRR